MSRAWPLLALALLGALLAWFFLGSDDAGRRGGGLTRGEGEGYDAPELIGNPVGPADPRPVAPQPPPPERPGSTVDAFGNAGAVFLEGTVIAADTREPLAGARIWLEPHLEPCPRLPAREALTREEIGRTMADLPPGRGMIPPARWATASGEDGRFAIRTSPDRPPPEGRIDLFASARGRVGAVVCDVVAPGPVAIELVKGLTLEGVVVAPDGAPVEGAFVRARPAPETPALPGHASAGAPVRTKADGHFAVEGLLPGGVLLEVDHPRFMPQLAGPFDPAANRASTVRLVPALLARFRLQTADAQTPEHVTIRWQTVGPNAATGVDLLPCGQADPEADPRDPFAAALPCGPHRVPCNAPSAEIQIQADGYAPWRSGPVELPPEGGERTFDVQLASDLDNGSVKISLTDEGGAPLSATEARVQVAIGRLDAAAASAAYVLEVTEVLTITSLPAGRYRLHLTSPAFAPLDADVRVDAGQATETTLGTRPPAKLRVRFFAPQATRVKFRLTQDGRPVPAIPEGSAVATTDEGQAVLSAGSEGVLLSGLASGTYVVEVLSEELTAPPTAVRVREGDTTETEIHVEFR